MQHVHSHANIFPSHSALFNVCRQLLNFVPSLAAVFVKSFVCRYFCCLWDMLLRSLNTSLHTHTHS